MSNNHNTHTCQCGCFLRHDCRLAPLPLSHHLPHVAVPLSSTSPLNINQSAVGLKGRSPPLSSVLLVCFIGNRGGAWETWSLPTLGAPLQMACYTLSWVSAKGQLALKTLTHWGSTEGSKKPLAKLEGTITWWDLGLNGGQSGSEGEEGSRWLWVDSRGGVNACLSNGSHIHIHTLTQPLL